MFHLDYLSCALTIVGTVLIGRRVWQGWLVAGLNSAIICWIGFGAHQYGLIYANVFCLVMYVFNVRQWRADEEPSSRVEVASATLPLLAHQRRQLRIRGREVGGAAVV